MKWKKYRLKTIEDAEDIVIATLYDCGIEGAEIEDKKPLTREEKEQMFVDILPDLPDDDGIAYLNFYLDPEETDTEAVLQKAREALDELRSYTDIGEGTIEESETEDKDWINNWKQYFKQFYVDDILIIPSWEQVKEEDRDKMILHIDPGTAFGTGMHETTQLCIRQLRKYVKPGMEMLDVGTGSGILGIVAVKFGAGHVLGTDLDPCAVPAVEDNRKANDIPDGAFDMIIGNMIDDQETRDKAGYGKYDIITANILADILVPMTPAVVPAMKKDGIYITSGILEDQAYKVLDACRAAGLEIVEQTQQGEWVSITARKPD
ncbi:50S ribosomal protein L11 methyltransferase [Bilifractor sp. HCP3S3_D3]|uniref:50S ribosomal protein L11 methyltransferase n=1 Tax=Bilifractor sp. HCP3S3_D3 TaxID=3438907 RepID=UPI003F8A2BB2